MISHSINQTVIIIHHLRMYFNAFQVILNVYSQLLRRRIFFKLQLLKYILIVCILRSKRFPFKICFCFHLPGGKKSGAFNEKKKPTTLFLNWLSAECSCIAKTHWKYSEDATLYRFWLFNATILGSCMHLKRMRIYKSRAYCAFFLPKIQL